MINFSCGQIQDYSSPKGNLDESKLLRKLGKAVGGLSVTSTAKLKEYCLDVVTKWLKSRNLRG
jgi:hypothetical protein